MLTDILTVNATLVQPGPERGDEAPDPGRLHPIEKVKKASAWGAHPVRSDLLGTAYGVNFAGLPELGWLFGYPFALALRLVVSLTLHVVFKGGGWLRLGRDPPSST